MNYIYFFFLLVFLPLYFYFILFAVPVINVFIEYQKYRCSRAAQENKRAGPRQCLEGGIKSALPRALLTDCLSQDCWGAESVWHRAWGAAGQQGGRVMYSTAVLRSAGRGWRLSLASGGLER